MPALTRTDYIKRATPCCGRKPFVSTSRPAHQFCGRCCRAYSLDAEYQIENWAWKLVDDVWTASSPERDYARLPGRGLS